MTSTTTRRSTPQQPWPSRRERETGERARSVPPTARPHGSDGRTTPRPAALPAVPAPRHARPEPTPPYVDPTPTDLLPIVGRQSSGAPSVAPGAPALADRRPTGHRPAPPTPCPPRPTVGSDVSHPAGHPLGHRVDGRVRVPRNGLGFAAAWLGSVALPLAALPVTAFLAAGLGVLALAFGVAGWSRTRSGAATNTGCAVVGTMLGTVALVLGIVGTVVFFQNPGSPVYDVTPLTASAVFSPIGE